MKIYLLLFFILPTMLFCDEYIVKFKNFDKQLMDNYIKNYNFRKYFTVSNDKLLNLKLNGEKKSNKKLADLRTYFKAELEIKQYLKLKKDKNIQLIYKDIKNIPRPVAEDIPPVTPNYEFYQGYIEDFENYNGFNARYAWQFVGGKGENVTVVDIEGGWNNYHEDLDIGNPFLYDENGVNLSGTPMLDDNDNNHGTSVLGEIAAYKNDYGITGIAYKSTIKVINDYSKEYGYSTADAIIRGISVLETGSIILLESQKGGPRYKYDENNPYAQFGLVPDEWLQAEFDAIKTATANGYVIIEAGANGEQNLDDEIYHTCNGDINTYFSDMSGHEPCFDTETRDSGAIIVGAGNPPSGNYGTPLEKMYYTSYGKRIDVQAWGYEIYTIGYGDLFYPDNDDNQSYTKQFGGTSGASPMITAVAALLQSRYKEKNNNLTLTSTQIREILKNHDYSHYPLQDNTNANIGPQPDIKLIFTGYLNDNYNCSPKCKEWEYCNQDEALCQLRENRCNINSDCSQELLCDLSSHTCSPPCDVLNCKNWETCNETEKKCTLKPGMCNIDEDCNKETESCNQTVHHCIDYCKNLKCPEHSTCQRFDNNTTAECVCDDNYLIDDNGICIYVPPQKHNEESSSCNFGGKENFYILFTILFMIMAILRKKYEKYTNK